MSLTDTELVRALKAIADPTRLKILRLLKQRGRCSIGKGEGMCACDIEAQIQLSQPTISHHMAVLSRAGLVQAEKQGLWMWYRRNEKSLKALAQSLKR
jgi:ArsR family transcriptional regulator, arsenate/arsenite/antimonite-responsive transcriptional repressor